MRTRHLSVCALIAAGLAFVWTARPDPQARQAASGSAPAPMEMRAFFDSRWTYQPRWSPDGRFLAYLQDDWDRQSLHVAEASGGGARELHRADRFIGDPRTSSAGGPPVWSPDSKELLYVVDGDVWLAPVADGRALPLTSTEARESGATFVAGARTIAYLSGGAVHLLDRDTGAVREIAAGPTRRFGGLLPSPDGARIAVSIGRSQAFTLVPSYVGRLIVFPMSQPDPPDVGVIDSATGRLTLVASGPRIEAPLSWSADGRRLLIERVSDDYKAREVFVVDAATGASEPVLSERDEKYLALGRAFVRFDDGGRSILYLSEASGWNHLYRKDLESGRVTPLTSGAWEVREAAPGPDGWVYYVSSEVGPAEPAVFRVPAAGGHAERVTSARGVHADLQVSPAGARLAYVRSGPLSLPDLWVQPADGGAGPARVTDSNPASSVLEGWQEPRVITYPGHDGLTVTAQLFVPRREPGRRYPAIVHTHQAASYQDVYYGPGPQKDNVAWYGWHQRLAQLGYVVLNVDYRGSTGYGRDYRVANYEDLGGGDRLDAVSGVEYLKTLGFVDTSRIGVYGMSYGGHLVLSLLTKNPGLFRAGIDISGVADMRMVYDTAGRAAVVARLSTPDRRPDLYDSSSAITHLDNLRDPVMVLHGTDDPNVSVLQSLQLVDELLRRGRRFEFEIYPGELHFFSRAASWVDAFAKMERFFEAEVRGPGSPGPDSARARE